MNDDSVELWSGQDAVRKRPSMYVGSTDTRGIHMLAIELFDNAVDQFRLGTATRLTVTLHRDGSLTCEDDGEGVSCDGVPEFDGRSFLEVVLTEMFAGGRFVKGRYGTGMGWGVGMRAVNALSEWLVAESHWHGSTWKMRCEAGCVTEPLVKIAETNQHGLRVTFKPDTTIFTDCYLDATTIVHRLSEISFLVAGFQIVFHDEAMSQQQLFLSTAGTGDFVRVLASHEETALPEPLRITGFADGLRLDAAFSYLIAHQTISRTISYANFLRTSIGGAHQLGFEHGLSAALKAFAARHQPTSTKSANVGNCRRGMVSVVSVELPDAHFEGPTRERLSGDLVYSTVRSLTKTRLLELFEKSPDIADRILQHLHQVQ